MIKKVGGKGNVILIEGNPAGQTNQDRVKGFRDAIAANANIKLLAQQPAMFRRDQAMNVMENLLQSHPKIDLVIALNDEMALGAVKAMEAAGRKGVLVSGFDAAPEGLEAITAKRLVATLDQDLHAQGGLGVRAAVDVLNGKKIPDWIKTGGEVVDLSNVNNIVARIKSFSGK
jgi:ribose transport system substrate-binding protein